MEAFSVRTSRLVLSLMFVFVVLGLASPVYAQEAAAAGETAAKPPGLQLVKFFTRHGMLALAAYGMMVRLHLDPVGLLAGVSSLVIAVAVEVRRDFRWRRFP